MKFIQSSNPPLPVYQLEADDLTGNKNFRVYNFEGTLPDHSELYIPHRKDHFLLVFVRHIDGKNWIDLTPYTLKDNTFYFASPGQVIVKEAFKEMWSTGIAFTNEFLALQDSSTLANLPIIRHKNQGNELLLTDADIVFVEDMLVKINAEYQQPGEWQHQMLSAYMTVFLTYLSRLYTEQYPNIIVTADQLLVKRFQSKINENFHQLHEVVEYASLLNISAGHLSDVVKMQSGKPAIKHIHERLILEAQRLLFHTEDTLKTIAFELGFSDPSYFNRFFKRETEFTPAGYREEIRKMYH